MNCEIIRELLPDVANGTAEVTPELEAHLSACAGCAGTLKAIEQTMALLDEWQAPEPTPYFDTRMQALLREERQKSAAHWYDFLRRPVMSVAAALVLAVGIGVVVRPSLNKNTTDAQNPPAAVGTAVGDLQTLDKNSELLSTYAALDDDDDDDTTVN